MNQNNPKLTNKEIDQGPRNRQGRRQEERKQRQEQRGPTADQKVAIFYSNWIDKGVQLNFHLRTGDTLVGKLLYYGRYEFVAQVAGDKPAILIMKHSVDWIERAANSAAGDKK